jgi:O-antigen/teichoic acid export membrane protein
MIIGLAGLPILLSGLGTENFASWAVLLGGSVAFYTLEMGMIGTVTKFIAEAFSRLENARISELMSNAIILLVAIYSIGFVFVMALSGPVGAWLKIPDTPLLSSKNLIIFVYLMVAVSSIARVGTAPFHAISRFDLVAGISLFHSVISNVAAWSVAWYCGRLDIVILTYWTCHALVLLAAQYWGSRLITWRFRPTTVNKKLQRSLLSHGFYLQFSDFAHFIHFQFDKMIIAGFTGLTEVAHYEIASRACMGLRSLCSSGFHTCLPRATNDITKRVDIWPFYQEMIKGAMWLIIFFLLAPLTVSPMFLFAWVGQIGYHGRYIFMFLAAGIAVNILVVPVSIFIQAMGRTSLEAGVSVCSIIMNVLFSLVLIRFWGKNGAAAGTGLAMILAGMMYMYFFHKVHQRIMTDTLKYLFHYSWPLLFICLIWFALGRAIEPLVICSRWYMGPASVVLYVTLVLALLVFCIYTGRIGKVEYEMVCRIPGLGAVVRRFQKEEQDV